MPRFLVSISLLVLSLLQAIAQPATKLPTDSAAVADSSRRTFTALIETPKASISGICLLVQDSDTIKGAIVNEFGITALDFVYTRKDDKVRLVSAAPMLNKWYMRPVITADTRNTTSDTRCHPSTVTTTTITTTITMILKNQLYQIEHSQESDGTEQFTIRLLEDCPIYRAHFPGQPITPGVCIVQIVQELLELTVGQQLEISEVKNVKFLNILTPKDNPKVDIVFTAIETSDESVSAKAEVKDATTVFTTVSVVCQPVKR